MTIGTFALGAVFSMALMVNCVTADWRTCDDQIPKAFSKLIADLPESHVILDSHSLELIPDEYFLSNITLRGLASLVSRDVECKKGAAYFKIGTRTPMSLTARWRSSAGNNGTISTTLESTAIEAVLEADVGKEGVKFRLISSTVTSVGRVSVELEGLGSAMDAFLSVLGSDLDAPAKTLWAALLKTQIKRILGETPLIPKP